jgi:eukaryotic-like serine/threonine-protein kinase
MDLERLQKIEALYNDALALPLSERAGFLNQTCGNDTGLRKEVESLLACEEQAETYMAKPAFEDMAHSMARDEKSVLVDRMLGRYHLLSLVGRGGMAEVYCAVDTRLNRLVAIKILPAYMAHEDELRRFEREARAIAALNHRHICTLHDVGHDGGVHYLVFEYLVGESLSARLSRDPLPLGDALEYAIQIADALSNAHETGIIHLDLKPQNIMLTSAGVKLLDFGIAELRYPDAPDAGASSPDAERPRSGTRGYMAPEQANGREVDFRADIFAFGAVMYQMFTGRSAFPTRDPEASPQPILEVQPMLPRALESLVGRCLAKDPAERWQSSADVLAKLRDVRDEL